MSICDLPTDVVLAIADVLIEEYNSPNINFLVGKVIKKIKHDPREIKAFIEACIC